MHAEIDDYAFANRMLSLAVAAMLAERTAHEGLLAADQHYLRWLNVDTDLPVHLRQRLQAWRAGLVDDRHTHDDYRRLLRGVRRLPDQRAKQYAVALIKIADTLQLDSGMERSAARAAGAANYDLSH